MSGRPSRCLHWALDPDVAHLNHGGFGAVPLELLDEQQRWRDAMERNPTAFLSRRLPDALAEARAEVGAFLGADAAGLVFVPNASTGVATVLASLPVREGDELLTTDQRYYAVRRQLEVVAARAGATVVEAAVPMPVPSAEAVVDAVTSAMTDRTRVIVVDHVTSPTGIVMPVDRLVAAARRRGIVTVVDGAHATAMVPVRLDRLGADFWTGNLHKWLCAPKVGAVLWAASPHRSSLRPLVASHYHDDGLVPAFDWTGTYDPTPLLCAPAAIRLFADLGWDEVRAANRELAAAGAAVVADALGTDLPVPDALSGAMRVVRLDRPVPAETARDVERRLLDEHGVEVPLMPGRGDARYVRLSAHVYNTLDDYRRLAVALPRVLAGTPAPEPAQT